MVRKNKIGRMLRKVGIRTIFSQWLQFLSIILINAVAVTLFVGFLMNGGFSDDPIHILTTMLICIFSSVAGGMVS